MRVGDSFVGGVTFLAGVVPRVCDVAALASTQWDPYADLRSLEPVDRYAAARAIPRREIEDRAFRRAALEAALQAEQDDRTQLEIASSGARLGSTLGIERLSAAIWTPPANAPAYLKMETVFILSEIHETWAADELFKVARSGTFANDELRQAAVWGLGKKGVRDYERLCEFLDDPEDDVVMHAIGAFGLDTPVRVIEQLVRALIRGPSDRVRSGASEALRLIGSEAVARELVAAASGSDSPWIPATLGRTPSRVLTSIAMPTPLLASVAPVRALAEESNWLMSRARATDFQFLLRQNL